MTTRIATLTQPDTETLRVEIDGIAADITVPNSDRAIVIAEEHFTRKGVLVDVR